MARERWFDSVWDRLLLPPKRIRPMGLIASQMSINPFEFYLLLALCIIGVLYLIGAPPPSSVAKLLPDLMVTIWAINLALGGFAALIGGLYRRRMDWGLAAYQFGWGLIGLATLVYGIALFTVFTSTAVFSGVSNVLWSAACFTRVLQVQRFFKLAERIERGEAPPQDRLVTLIKLDPRRDH